MRRRVWIGGLLCLALAGRLHAQTNDPDVDVAWSALVQADARWTSQRDDEAAYPSFLLRRVRVELEATLPGGHRLVVEPDFGEGGAELNDGWVEARLGPALALRAGRFKTPFGLERLRSSRRLWFAERGLPSELAPGRDLGVMLEGRWDDGRTTAAVGYFGGVADGASARGPTGPARDVAARVFFHPFPAPLSGLGVGVAATAGTASGTPDAPALAAYETPSGVALPEGRAAWADGARHRLAPQAMLAAGPLHLLAEYTLSRHRVQTPVGRSWHAHRAWQVAALWTLAPEHKPGAVALSARLHGLALDADARPGANGVRGGGVALHWHPAPGMRLSLAAERFTGSALPEADLFLVARAQYAF